MDDVHIDVDGGGIILVFLSQADEDGGFGMVVGVDTVDEVGASLNHSLVDQLLVGFFLAAATEVVEKLVPETAVNQVTGCMLRTADIEVDILPVFIGFPAHEYLVIMRIHVTEIIG